MVSLGRRLLLGAAWTYGGQVATIVAQFAYAAITARLIGADGFGAYAIALAVSGFMNLIAAGGFGQAVHRMGEPDRPRLRGLVTVALAIGLVSGAVLWLVAPLLAGIWGDPAAAEIVRWLALGTLITPLQVIGGALMRRRNQFRLLAIVALSSNLLGMAAGAIIVWAVQTPQALVASALLSQAISCIAMVAASGRDLLGLGRPRHAMAEIGYSGRLLPAKIVEYVIGNATKLATARWLTVSSLGYWNRADVVTMLPFQQVTAALVQVLSPEFRHDIADASRARRVWTELFSLIAWIALPASAIAAVVIPHLVPVLFGPGWEVAAALAAPLAIAAGLQLLSVVLGNAIEVLGRFRWIWATSLALLALQAVGVVGILVLRDLWVAMLVLLLTQVLRHSIHVVLCVRAGYLDARGLLGQYALAALTAVIAAACAAGAIELPRADPSEPWRWVVAALLVAVPTAVVVALRGRLAPVRIIAKYGLLRRAGAPDPEV